MRELLRESTSYRRRGTHPSGPRVSCNMFFQATLCFVCAFARTVEREGGGGDLKLGKIPNPLKQLQFFISEAAAFFNSKTPPATAGRFIFFSVPEDAGDAHHMRIRMLASLIMT